MKSIDLSRELGAAAIGTLGQAFRLDRAAQQSGILRRELPDLDLHIVNYGTLFGYLLLPERCVPSARPYRGLLDLDYPFHDRTVTVTTCGRICFNRQKINLSTVFAGHAGSNQSRTPSDQKCYLCLRNKPLPMWSEWTRIGLAGAGGFEPRHRCGHAGQRKGVAHMLTATTTSRRFNA